MLSCQLKVSSLSILTSVFGRLLGSINEAENVFKN